MRFSGGNVLPAGVTLSAISGGPTYYGDNGFTKATSPIIFGGITYSSGWDSPSFIPLGPTLSFFITQNDANLWVSLGLNVAWLNANDQAGQLDLFHNNSISVIQGYQYLAANTIHITALLYI